RERRPGRLERNSVTLFEHDSSRPRTSSARHAAMPCGPSQSRRPQSARNYDRYSRSSSSLSIRRHALLRQLFHRLIVLRQALQPHTAQHMRSLSELDVVIANDLDAVAPRIEEIEEGSRQCLDPGLRERCADRLLVVDHKAEVATIVTGLSAPLLQR